MGGNGCRWPKGADFQLSDEQVLETWCTGRLLLFSYSVMSDSLQPHRLQHTRLLCPSLSPGVRSDSCQLSWWCRLQPSHPVPTPSPVGFNLSQHQGLFQWVGSSHQVAKVLELQHQSFQWLFTVDFLWGWLVWSPCRPRDSQESSAAPQFKSIPAGSTGIK